MKTSNIRDFVTGAAKSYLSVEKATSYCDYIAHVCAVALVKPDPERIVTGVGPVQSDLHPRHGYMLSAKKTIEAEDRNGNRYRITVEDMGR